MKNFIKTYKKIFNLMFIIIFLGSLLYLLSFIKMGYEARQESSLLNSLNINDESKKEVSIENLEEQKNIEISERMLQVQELQKKNEDIVGWIEITNTNINYPVLKGKDNEYYLTHNYKKEKTAKGSIFLNKDCEVITPSTNLLIYGHNMKNGEMFTGLLKYESYEYFLNHPIIRFTTSKEDVEYEIFSIFKSRVYYKSEKNVFRFYNFINAENEEEYNEFIKKAKESSIFDTGITPSYGENLITLITCSYHVDDGRFVVIGRELP